MWLLGETPTNESGFYRRRMRPVTTGYPSVSKRRLDSTVNSIPQMSLFLPLNKNVSPSINTGMYYNLSPFITMIRYFPRIKRHYLFLCNVLQTPVNAKRRKEDLGNGVLKTNVDGIVFCPLYPLIPSHQGSPPDIFKIKIVD